MTDDIAHAAVYLGSDESGFVNGEDMVIDGGSTPGGPPSTVLDMAQDPPVIVRPGALDGEVMEFLGLSGQ